MAKIKDLRNLKFGHLTVLNETPVIKNKKTYWNCLCNCGNTKYIEASHLKDGSTTSCGCMRKQKKCHYYKTQYKRLVKILNHMKQRCYNKNAPNYDNYGGREIKICDEWLRNSKNFYIWAEHNGYRDDLSIDRIDVNGDYSPSNCRWATPKQQSNNRRNNIKVNLLNKTLTISEWAEYFNLDYKECKKILKKG